MEKERFVERMLETENLTDELEDEDANWLLNWGIQRLDEVIEAIEDEEVAGSRVNALMAVVRKINRIAGSYTRKDAQALASDLAELDQLFSAAFLSDSPSGSEKITADQEAAAAALAQMPTRQALETLARRPTRPG